MRSHNRYGPRGPIVPGVGAARHLCGFIIDGTRCGAALELSGNPVKHRHPDSSSGRTSDLVGRADHASKAIVLTGRLRLQRFGLRLIR